MTFSDVADNETVTFTVVLSSLPAVVAAILINGSSSLSTMPTIVELFGPVPELLSELATVTVKVSRSGSDTLSSTIGTLIVVLV